jgi:hypothetical protein
MLVVAERCQGGPITVDLLRQIQVQHLAQEHVARTSERVGAVPRRRPLDVVRD